MNPLLIVRIFLIKCLAGDMGIVLNLDEVTFKPKYDGQPIYGDNLNLTDKKNDSEAET